MTKITECTQNFHCFRTIKFCQKLKLIFFGIVFSLVQDYDFFSFFKEENCLNKNINYILNHALLVKQFVTIKNNCENKLELFFRFIFLCSRHYLITKWLAPIITKHSKFDNFRSQCSRGRAWVRSRGKDQSKEETKTWGSS